MILKMFVTMVDSLYHVMLDTVHCLRYVWFTRRDVSGVAH